MPGFKADLFCFDLDSGSFTKTLDSAIKTQVRQAARAFAGAAAAAVPVRTGFARGTFRNIDEAVGGSSASLPNSNFLKNVQAFRRAGGLLGSNPTRMGGLSIPKEYYYGGGGRVFKTPNSGRQFATKPTAIITASNFIYRFTFEVNITYFTINDMFRNPRTPSSPWNAFKKGQAAFEEHLENALLTKIPHISGFLYERHIRTTNETVTNVVRRNG